MPSESGNLKVTHTALSVVHLLCLHGSDRCNTSITLREIFFRLCTKVYSGGRMNWSDFGGLRPKVKVTAAWMQKKVDIKATDTKLKDFWFLTTCTIELTQHMHVEFTKLQLATVINYPHSYCKNTTTSFIMLWSLFWLIFWCVLTLKHPVYSIETVKRSSAINSLKIWNSVDDGCYLKFILPASP